MSTNTHPDASRFVQLIELLPAEQYGACLSDLIHRLVPIVLVDDPTVADMEPEDAVNEYIRERLGHSRSETFSAPLVSMVRNYDSDFDEWLFSDDREQMILVADAALRGIGEEVLERYLDCRDNYPEYGVIHPSDYSGPKEEDEDEEWARHVSDFATWCETGETGS